MPHNTYRPRVLLHSDCDFFAGCENMVAIFANSEIHNENYDLHISFRETISYSKGFFLRSPNFGKKIPLNLRVPDLSKHFDVHKEKFFRRWVRFIVYLVQLFLCSFQNLFVLLRLLLKLRPDVMHINNGGYPGALSCRLAVIAAKLAGVKNILFFANNMAVGYESPYRKLDRITDKLVARNVNYFLTGSVEAALRLQEVLNIPKNKLVTVPNATQIRSVFESPNQTRSRLNISNEHSCVFGMIGVALPRKGHKFLLETILFATQNETFLNLKPLFLIEGDQNSMSNLQDFVTKNELQDLVRFVGNEENIFEFYSILDYLVYPSIVHEDFPNVISEALSVGVPVISARVAGAVEQIENSVNGFLFDIGSKESLASIFWGVTQNPESRKTMSEAAKLKYRLNYSPEIVVEKYSRLYKGLLGGNDGY
jgi:glycosyltransferase involved in cell wall biosynthesis